jgi:N-acetyltransferase
MAQCSLTRSLLWLVYDTVIILSEPLKKGLCAQQFPRQRSSCRRPSFCTLSHMRQSFVERASLHKNCQPFDAFDIIGLAEELVWTLSPTYLKRISYDGPLAPTAETLCQLQVAHLLSVPFENLSTHAGEPIVLADEALFEKVVVRRRGGFCYELNGLFAALLRALGFNVAMLSASVMKPEGKFGPELITWRCWLSSESAGWWTSGLAILSASRCCWMSGQSGTRARLPH